ncbi:hypothetical protein HDU98_005431 [Podochytrium sp. JEL0797]|nr:hypothetical protein HDU98_005431 [Podochytrium sp. JEL0797]
MELPFAANQQQQQQQQQQHPPGRQTGSRAPTPPYGDRMAPSQQTIKTHTAAPNNNNNHYHHQNNNSPSYNSHKDLPKHTHTQIHEQSNQIAGQRNGGNSHGLEIPQDYQQPLNGQQQQQQQNSGVQFATVQQPQQFYPPYVYMYQASYNVPSQNRNTPESSNARNNAFDSFQPTSALNQPQSPMYFTPRSSPSGGRGGAVKPAMASPLYPNTSNHQQQHFNGSSGSVNNPPTVVSAVTPYYGRATYTPGGSRRFQNPSTPSTPNGFNAVGPPLSPFFVSNSNPNPVGRSPTPPSMAGGVSSTIARYSVVENLNSPARRSRRELSFSGTSGVDWEAEGTSCTNLYIKGLKNSCTDDDLYDICKVYGNIHSSKAILDLTTHECKGFGFVMYETIEESQHALNELMTLGYTVSFAKETFNTRLKNLQDEESTNVYVSNLPLEMDEDGMLQLFAPHHIISTKILRDPSTQHSRGVGFARMESRHAAQHIISEFNGRPLDNGQCLQVRFADSAAQKRFKMMQQQLLTQAPLASPIRGVVGATNLYTSPIRGGWRGDVSGGKISAMAEVDVGDCASGVSVLSEDTGSAAPTGYVTYYDGYAPNNMVMSHAPYGYPVGPQAGLGPQIMNGAYYYPAPPPSAVNHGPQPPMMFQPVMYQSLYPPSPAATAAAAASAGGKDQVPLQEPLLGSVSPAHTNLEGVVAEAAETGTVDATDELANGIKGMRV